MELRGILDRFEEDLAVFMLYPGEKLRLVPRGLLPSHAAEGDVFVFSEGLPPRFDAETTRARREALEKRWAAFRKSNAKAEE